MIYLLSQTIDQIADRLPEKEAFRFGGQGISYASLVQQGNALAHLLQEYGVDRGDRVGIYLNKSLESAIAIYGIWKAGAAYVPLDPFAPVKRLQFICNNCEIRHLVSMPAKRKQLVELLTKVPNLLTVVGLSPEELNLELNRDLSSDHQDSVQAIPWDIIRDNPKDTPPKMHLVEQDLAYVIYTSGSTGEPKGIMHTHRSGLSYAMMAAKTYDLHEGDRLGNHAPLHFDQSTMEYFAGPLVGATTIIIPEIYTKLPASLSELIQKEAISIWYSVPFALIQLLLRGVMEKRDLRSLRWVLFGGEPFPPKYLNELMDKLPQARFSNVYGPAEINQCTYYHVPYRTDSKILEDIPIGKIWENAEGLVVDGAGQLVAPGQVGELWVRTPTMMSGYWRRPDLNEKVFRHYPMSEEQQGVFFRTGDLVQQQPDGNYKFVGRKDRQVKIRGYRVELDEIEGALVAHEQVEEAAVFTVPRSEENQEIEAAVILSQGARVNPADLMNFLGSQLPNYAVPTYITLLDNFPRTVSHKIDRRTLQKQSLNRSFI